MISIRAGHQNDAPALAELIYASAPTLLSYLFGSASHALRFLHHCTAHFDGQYSAARHMVAHSVSSSDSKEPSESDQHIIGCISLWSHDMPQCFHEQTLHCLAQFLDAQQLAHIISANDALLTVFSPPKQDELCLGHLSVNSSWQGQQVGTKLIAHAIEQARVTSKARLVLDVDIENKTALRFYEQCGFIGEDVTSLQASGQNFVRMSMTL